MTQVTWEGGVVCLRSTQALTKPPPPHPCWPSNFHVHKHSRRTHLWLFHWIQVFQLEWEWQKMSLWSSQRPHCACDQPHSCRSPTCTCVDMCNTWRTQCTCVDRIQEKGGFTLLDEFSLNSRLKTADMHDYSSVVGQISLKFLLCSSHFRCGAWLFIPHFGVPPFPVKRFVAILSKISRRAGVPIFAWYPWMGMAARKIWCLEQIGPPSQTLSYMAFELMYTTHHTTLTQANVHKQIPENASVPNKYCKCECLS